MRRWLHDNGVFCLYNFGSGILDAYFALSAGTWKKVMESSDEKWGGSGGHGSEYIAVNEDKISVSLAPHSFVLYRIFNEGD